MKRLSNFDFSLSVKAQLCEGHRYREREGEMVMEMREEVQVGLLPTVPRMGLALLQS